MKVRLQGDGERGEGREGPAQALITVVTQGLAQCLANEGAKYSKQINE